MKPLIACVAFFTFAATAGAADVKSVYTKVDLKKCKQTQKADSQVFEGAWRCAGFGGYDVFITAADAREQAGFSRGNVVTCAGAKTFGGFNSVGGTVEWRVKDGKAIAAILRWTVSIDPEDSKKTATWLVVNKLDGDFSCHMHYVAGSYPSANDVARNAADTLSSKFNCEKDKPTFDSTIGAPNISLEPCENVEQY